MQCGQEFSFSDLKSKIVINVVDGKILGNIIDIIFFPGSGKILGFVVPGEKKGWFRTCENIFIPYSSVCMVGIDCILVRLCSLQKPPTEQNNKLNNLIGILDNENLQKLNQNSNVQNQNNNEKQNENFANVNKTIENSENQQNYYEYYQNQQNLQRDVQKSSENLSFQNRLDY